MQNLYFKRRRDWNCIFFFIIIILLHFISLHTTSIILKSSANISFDSNEGSEFIRRKVIEKEKKTNTDNIKLT